MQQEVTGTMEKKRPSASPSPVHFRNGSNGNGEKKCDFVSQRSRNRKHGLPLNGNKTGEVTQSSRPSPNSKWNKSYCDKRPRQRGSYETRQREEVAESTESEAFDLVLTTGSRKANANHLLNFKFAPRESDSYGRWGRSRNEGGARNRNRKPLPVYKKEQFLQASCQFVVREGGEYIEQAVNPDALVSWDLIEVIRCFSTETLTCPICLQVPFAGKITKCGHVFCWACILHYLKLDDNNYRKCPICYEAVTAEDLKSVQPINVPDYSVGDEIEMKLMKKSKGSVYVMPKSEWEDRKGQPLNVRDGNNTNFMKLLVASLVQIQKQVIDMERAALAAHMAEAEESEAIFIQMAQALLHKREISLKKVFKKKIKRKVPSIPGLVISSDSCSEEEEEEEEEKDEMEPKAQLTPPDNTLSVPSVGSQSKPTKIYTDAFEDQIHAVSDDVFETPEKLVDSTRSEDQGAASGVESKSMRGSAKDNQSESQKLELPVDGNMPQTCAPISQVLPDTTLTVEETAETLELPLFSPLASNQPRKSAATKPKDAYFFYQASNGQHMYLHSLNAHCLAKEYGSLENSPDTIKATIVSIERCFMTEEVRKRLRYLNHVPLTCEFYVMELRFGPPLVSKETLKFFHADFEKKRKARMRKTKDEKLRAKKFEVEVKKSFGIYPEVQIPLSNWKQFPMPMNAIGGSASEDNSQGFAETSTTQGMPTLTSFANAREIPQKNAEGRDTPASLPNSPETDSSQSDSISFAQMLKAGKSVAQPTVWGRATVARTRTVSGSSSSGSREVGGDPGSDEDLPAPSYNASMCVAIEKALHYREMQHQALGNQPATTTTSSGGKKKKRKEKQLLFSTAMARKH